MMSDTISQQLYSVAFQGDLYEDENLSAIAFLPDGHLLLGSDEGNVIQVLKPEHDRTYGVVQTLSLTEGSEDEVDSEDICCLGNTCYGVGSHSAKRKS